MKEDFIKSKLSSISVSLKKTKVLVVICTILIVIAYIVDFFTEINYLFTILLILMALIIGINAERKIALLIAFVIIVLVYIINYTTLGYNSEILWIAQKVSLNYELIIFLFYPILVIGTFTIVGLLTQVLIFYSKTPKDEFEKKESRFIICPNCNSANHEGTTTCKKCGSIISTGRDVKL